MILFERLFFVNMHEFYRSSGIFKKTWVSNVKDGIVGIYELITLINFFVTENLPAFLGI